LDDMQFFSIQDSTDINFEVYYIKDRFSRLNYWIAKKGIPVVSKQLYLNFSHKSRLQIKRHGRISALKCMRETEPCIYTRTGELRAPEIIISQ